MSAQYTSKHGIVSKRPVELYMGFVDMRAFKQMLPADKQEGVVADYDSIRASVQGFPIGVKVTRREPYSRIELADDGAPIHFGVVLHFDEMSAGMQTDFWVEVDAELNMMLKMMLGSKLQQALDSMVDGLVAASEGRMPEGFDPNMFN